MVKIQVMDIDHIKSAGGMCVVDPKLGAVSVSSCLMVTVLTKHLIPLPNRPESRTAPLTRLNNAFSAFCLDISPASDVRLSRTADCYETRRSASLCARPPFPALTGRFTHNRTVGLDILLLCS